MINISFASSKYFSISHCSARFFNDVDVVEYKFGIPFFSPELAYILMPEKGSCEFKSIKEAEVS
jgi:hypothetical protein